MTAGPYGEAVLASETATVRQSEQGNRSNILSRAAYNLGTLTASCGLHPDQVRQALLDAALVAGLPESEALRTINASLSKGERHPRAPRPAITSKDDAKREVAALASIVLAHPWAGHYGRRCCITLMGVLTIAHDQGAMEISVSINRLLLTIGSKNRQQVQRALAELVEDGWLLRIRRGGPGHSARYRLQFPGHARTQATTTLPTNELWPDYATTISHLGADAYRPKGLNKTAWRVLRHLAQSAEWTSQADLARQLGISASTASRYCRPEGLLVRYGLVSRSTTRRGAVRLSRWASPRSMTVIAERLGVDGQEHRDRSGLIGWYIARGYLTADLRWVDPRTGDPTSHKATWLLPRPVQTPNQGSAADDGTSATSTHQIGTTA